MYFPLFVGVLCLYLFCYALLCVHSSFAIILKRKIKLVALLVLSYRCIATINVLWLSSRCRGLVCSVWLWYFLIILTYFSFQTNVDKLWVKYIFVDKLIHMYVWHFFQIVKTIEHQAIPHSLCPTYVNAKLMRNKLMWIKLTWINFYV